MRVGVTGVGGPAGYTVAKTLRAQGYDVCAIDPDPLVADIPGPWVGDVGFVQRMATIVQWAHLDVLISTVAEELPALTVAAQWDYLGTCRHWFPAHSAVEGCLDKAKFAKVMALHGVPHPATGSDAPWPYVVKPRYGRGSRGVAYYDDRDQVRLALRNDPDLIVQQRITGPEWTADCLVDRDGTLAACVPRWRLAVRGGISVKGKTFESQPVRTLCTAALTAMKLRGVANVQGIHETVIEVNPRFSGGLALSLAAGADLVGAYLQAILHPDQHIPELEFRPGVMMVRHFDEVFYDQASQAQPI